MLRRKEEDAVPYLIETQTRGNNLNFGFKNGDSGVCLYSTNKQPQIKGALNKI